jgi:hypothetical protein
MYGDVKVLDISAQDRRNIVHTNPARFCPALDEV